MKVTCFLFLLILLLAVECQSQTVNNADPSNKFKIVVAGKQYEKSAWYRFLWGNNYRKVWTTPLKAPVFLLDTVKGGLQPVKEGGGHQTKSLRLKTKDDKEYALRSVSKTLGAVLPKDLKGTFAEELVNDEVSMSNPYGAAIVPVLAEAAHIYHTNPQFVYVPEQPLLDTFNKKYGNNLYLFEQKTDGNWSDADNLGNFSEFFDTQDVIKKMLDDNKYKVDQAAFVRARIFDWFINDWDRHEDQWSWGEKKIGDKIFFVPVPQDRDQAFSKRDGVLTSLASSAAGLSYMQSFDNNLKDIKTFTYEERNLDRYFTNEITLKEWQNIAKELQQSLSDKIIDEAVKQLPPEIYNVCGTEISTKLKARRTHLLEWATTYSDFINEQVQVTGSKQNEMFDVERLNKDETSVKIFSLNDAHQKKDTAVYTRIFKSNETKEIRLFGIGGNDVYHVNGELNNLKIRVIGGAETDSVINENGGKIYVYDDQRYFISNTSSAKLHLSGDSSLHNFNYNWFKYDKAGFKPSVFYNFQDRIYVGLGYKTLHNAWRKEPFASKQLFDVHYSISESAFSFTYTALFPKTIGNSDLSLLANYDVIRWIRFWGLGNDTKYIPKDRMFFTARSRQWIIQPSVIHASGFSTVTFSPFIQGVQILNDTDKFISKTFITNTQDYKWRTFAGASLNYKFIKLNDSIVPTKGFMFFADVTDAQNLKESNKNFVRVGGNMQLFVPLGSSFSYVFRSGAATVTGKPEFYQYPSIGGGPNMRGFKRDRFRGKTAFWNTSDLRFISNVKSYFFSVKAGLIAFFDNGRVWMPGENSDTWHTDAGGGITIAPFNKIQADITYGFSSDGRVIQVRINKYF